MAAQQIAQEKGQQQIDALHLLLALMTQESSLVLTIIIVVSAIVLAPWTPGRGHIPHHAREHPSDRVREPVSVSGHAANGDST